MSDYSVSIALKAIDEATGPVNQVQGALDGLKSKLSSVASTLLSGFGMGIGMDFGSKFSEAIRGAATAGFEFNKTMEDTKTGIAAVIMANMDFTSSSGGVVTSQDKIGLSMKMASEIQEKLKVDALGTAASYQELAGAFNSALSPALTAGITNMDQVRQITVQATQAMSALGIPTNQAAQEIRAMFAGEKGPDNRLNNQLGITKEELAKVKGNAEATAQLFLTKLAPYSDMAAEATKNFSTRMSNLGDAFDQVMGAATKPIFDAFKTAITDLTGNVGGFQGKLTEIGTKIGGLVTEVSPYIPKLIDFGIALLGAGVSFLTSLSPVLPILGEVLELITGLVESLGPMGLGLIAGAKAFEGIAGGAAAAVKGVTAFGTWISTVGIATVGAYAIAIGVAVAALYALKLASDLSKENAAAEKSYTGMADTMVMNLGRIEKAHPELKKEVDRLKNSIVSAQQQGGDAVEKSAGTFQTEFNKIASIAKYLPTPLGATEDAIKAVAKAPPVDPKVGKAIKDLGEEHDKVLAKIRAHIAYVGSDDAKNAYSKLGADAGFEIGELTKKWGTESDIVLARQEQLRVDLKAKYIAIAKDVKEVQVGMGTETYLQSAYQTSWVMQVPQNMYQAWDTQSDYVKTRNETLSADLFGESANQILYVKRAPDAMAGFFEENCGKALDSIEKLGGDMVAYWPTPLGQVKTTMAQAWIDIADSVKTPMDSAKEFVDGVWGSMAGGIDTFFGDAFTGKGIDLQKTFEGIFGGIQQSFANMVSDMVQGWAMGKTSITDGLTTMGQAMHPFQGGGTGAILGNTITGGAIGYGMGSAAGSLSGAPGWSTGATAGGTIAAAAIASGVLGAEIGTGIWPIVGTVVGIIIGGIIGVLAAPNTENHVSAAFSEMLSKSTTNAFAAAGRKVLESQQNWMVGLFELGGEQAGLSAAALTKAYSDSVKALLTGGHAEISAGDNKDIENGLQRFLQENLPRLALQAAFGQTGFGPHGNRDETGGQGGLDWWINWMDKDGNAIAQKLYDPEAPIPKMLSGLGFTARKINELATQITTDNPEEFKKRLENLVGLVVDIDKAVAAYAGGRTGIEAELTARAGQTTTSYFAQTAQDIADAAKAMDALTGDDALARARQIASASNQRYEEELQAIQRIRDLATSISESIAGQREDIKVRLLDTTGKTNYYQAQINALMGELGNATTEGQVQGIVQQIQKFASSLTDIAFSGDKGPNMGLVNWIDQILGTTDITAQGKLSTFIDDIVGTNDILAGVLGDLKTRFTDIDDATEDLADNASDAADGLVSVGNNANSAATALARFTAALEAASEYLGGGGNAIKTIRADPRVLMPQVGR